jgi:signal transduction histidine kinase
LLGTTAEILSSTLQRWQAEDQLRRVNNRLEQQVKIRTTELSDTITLLQQEIKERERAEAEIQQMVETLEQRVAARTDEVATFFDLTVLASQSANLIAVFEQALPRILEVTRSRIICLHLLEADRTGLYLAAQQNLPGDARGLLQSVELTPIFQRWLQQPNDPLVTTTLSQLATLPPAFHLPECQTYLGAQIRVGHQTEGILSCYRFTERGFGLDEIALVTVLAEQLGMEMSSNCEVELYQIMVETLNNVVKHAAAGRLILHLTHVHPHLHLLIADDGRGFDLTQTEGGLGLRNIRERVARLNGQLSIFSEPGHGARLEALIPYPMEDN